MKRLSFVWLRKLAQITYGPTKAGAVVIAYATSNCIEEALTSEHLYLEIRLYLYRYRAANRTSEQTIRLRS